MMNAPTGASTSIVDRSVALASIVVITMAASVVMFGIVGTMVTATRSAEGLAMPASVGLVAAAFALLVASVLYRRTSYQPARLIRVFTKSGEAGLAQQLVRATIISGSLSEGVGIIGLVLGILTGDTYYLYALCAVGLLGVLSNFPRASKWRELSADITKWAQAGSAGGTPEHGD